ncbi:MAG TPA: serine/threonine-protein kinase [Geothrix sp.]|nr:serine/threonine-protein kinase [Geothrix sp.]
MLRRLGKYEIVRPLGRGAMGEVFLARDTVLNRDVAVKTIQPALLQGEQAEARFRAEALAAGRLNHPNLVTVLDFDQHEGTCYLVMEWVQGQDLADLLEARSLSQGQCLEVLAQVCEGLACAHRNGIVHRDVKPSNVRVQVGEAGPFAKLMDFGIARGHDSRLTATGILMGTVSYMAPEYIRTGQSSPQSDLFAVGVILHECLTGERLFESDSTVTTFYRIVTDPIPSLDPAFIHGISPHITAVCRRALAKEPNARFSDGEAFAKALRACKDPDWHGFQEDAVAGTPPAARNRRHKFSAVLIGGAVLAATGILLRGTFKPPAAPLPAAPPRLAQTPPAPGRPVTGNATPAFQSAQPQERPPASVPVEAQPAPAQETPASAPARLPEPPPPAPPAPKENASAKLARATSLIAEDPGEALNLLRPLAAEHPGDAQIQGPFLAALYRAHRAVDFEQAYANATAAGLNLAALLKVPSFKAVIQEETRLHRNRSLYCVLPGELLTRMLSGAVPGPDSEPSR